MKIRAVGEASSPGTFLVKTVKRTSPMRPMARPASAKARRLMIHRYGVFGRYIYKVTWNSQLPSLNKQLLVRNG
ncbi:hypothetical protein [Sphingomonas kyeonggiensis]|uniref:Uncharacterized protein n=1 Tax=Sphingomonas kyeonggiensis TaxID=1268553 RepID=A0A7W6JVC0_9SPHN|nr:hypothetical protein [Sphingomonas kyeonggiensis]MBB4100218.1 hypothetical protein [Sphingomonas kyeonggiensis]